LLPALGGFCTSPGATGHGPTKLQAKSEVAATGLIADSGAVALLLTRLDRHLWTQHLHPRRTVQLEVRARESLRGHGLVCEREARDTASAMARAAGAFGRPPCFLPYQRFTAWPPVRCGMLSRILAACASIFPVPMRIDHASATAERHRGAFDRGVEPTHDPG
jgi:hypothetical protein